MATAYADTINGQHLTISIDAVAWAQPAKASWLTRCRQLNRLLGKSSHLLRIQATDKTEPVWYAGVAGTSLAAGVERMAIDHDPLRDAIVAFPLDTRIYVADLQKGLVRGEWVLYPDAFERQVESWRAEARHFVLLTSGGRLQPRLPNAAEVPVDIDTDTMTFRHASLALLATGLLRWRDCVSMFGVAGIAFALSSAFSWWQGAQHIEPLQRVASFVKQPAAPVRHTASAELAKLAMTVADHDIALWNAHEAIDFSYDASNGVLELKTENDAPISTAVGQLPTAPNPVPLQPYTLHGYQSQLASYLASPNRHLTFGDPYPIGIGTELEQHVTVTIGNAGEVRDLSIAAELIDLSERLVRLPITLYDANCKVTEGVIASCDLNFVIRGLRA